MAGTGHGIATVAMAPFALYFDRRARPKMTLMTFFKISLLGLLEPVIDQNLFCLGMIYTTATFATALYNTLPAVTFILALLLDQARKTQVSEYQECEQGGWDCDFSWRNNDDDTGKRSSSPPLLDQKTFCTEYNRDRCSQLHQRGGAVFVSIGCLSYACFMILQVRRFLM
ncbi:PREDICTED: WAT1-related protein At2g37460-like [Camelina sativa]|uniref:WAT1-related protein At2g37460-like n=1 Tax=Camelina sativa TaxID=90675 RepID=A0ABM0T947_CAMSA|nr:PREDICTED: WAT1-related protein At2g37460-like [Camelina sativa]